MKIRTGLVSNSSVSSFILYGIRLTDKHYTILGDNYCAWAEDHGLEYHSDDDGILGKNIADWEYGIDSMSESEWNAKMDEARREMSKLGIDGEYRIFMGMVDG